MLAFYSHIPAWLSVILVPVLIIILLLSLVFLIKNRGGGMGVSKLNKTLIEADEFIQKNKDKFDSRKVKLLNKKLKYALSCCDFIESEELYELDNAVSAVKKAVKIGKALTTACVEQEKIPHFAKIIDKEIERAKFSLAAVYSGNKNNPEFSAPDENGAEDMKELLSKKKKIEKAQNFLDSIK